MLVARILLFTIITTLLTNRVASTLLNRKSIRVYRKEFRYYIVMAVSSVTLFILLSFIINPAILAFAQFHLPNFVYWVGSAFMLTATTLWIWSKYHLGNNWSPRIAIRQDHTLTTSGPYQFVRHPIYTSYILQVLGMGLATANLAVTLPCLAICLLTLLRISDEEDSLLREFGHEYTQYQSSTGKVFPKLLRK